MLHCLFLVQLRNLKQSCIISFKQELLEGLQSKNHMFPFLVGTARIVFGKLFAGLASEVQTKCERQFADGAKDSLMEDTDWTWKDDLELFRNDVGGVASQCRKEERKKLVTKVCHTKPHSIFI
jgi:hypothetical protein